MIKSFLCSQCKKRATKVLGTDPNTWGQKGGMMYNKTLGREVPCLIMCVMSSYRTWVFIEKPGGMFPTLHSYPQLPTTFLENFV
jgi:hypothetical protein